MAFNESDFQILKAVPIRLFLAQVLTNQVFSGSSFGQTRFSKLRFQPIRFSYGQVSVNQGFLGYFGPLVKPILRFLKYVRMRIKKLINFLLPVTSQVSLLMYQLQSEFVWISFIQKKNYTVNFKEKLKIETIEVKEKNSISNRVILNKLKRENK